MRLLANIVSLLFHPFLLPTYGVFCILFLVPFLYGEFGTRQVNADIMLLFALTFVFPTVSLLIMKGLDLIPNLQLREGRDRIIPYIAISTFYFWGYWFFNYGTHTVFGSNPLVGTMLLGIVLGVFIAFFVNLFEKVSIHTVGMGGAFGLAIYLMPMAGFDMNLPFCIVILLAGLVGMSRLILDAHSLRQVAYGYLIGFIGMSVAPRLNEFVIEVAMF